MSDTFDHYFDALDADEGRNDYPAIVTCRRCGAGGLHWQNVTAPDGRSEKPVLFDEGFRRHYCQPSADDFEVVA